ncbi:unnamed protein product [Adineta ricciae]|uniref:STAS domain-containing protein n=1 Tax=Adineta ricciae TaxID=249248 RepID=A0A814PSD4_ADIRI|nr:unnamed protein product [Adineta ricciae]
MGDNKEVSNNDIDQDITVVSEFIPKTHSFQSFVDHYGADETHLTRTDYIKHYFQKHCGSFSFLYCLNAILERIPLIRCLKDYKIRQNLYGDIMAGIIVAIMHIPQGMAYGVLTTLPPVHGLYVSFYPVVVYMIFGTCPHLSIGTFAVISLMVAQAIEGILSSPMHVISNGNETFSNESIPSLIDEKIRISTTLALLVGLIQILLFFLRLGFLSVYLTEPFISGFTSGSAVHVLTSQLPLMFGVKSPRGIKGPFKIPKFYIKLVHIVLRRINWVSSAIGLTSIVLLYFAKYLNERFKAKIRIVLPLELVLIIIGTVLSHFTHLHEDFGISIVGEIKRGLPPPALPTFDNVNQLILPAITIAAVSFSISISMAKMFSRKHGYKVSSNQELLAYGMANVLSSFFQCYPNAGSLSRSVVQEGSGGKTLLIGGFSSIVLASVIVALTPLFRSLPMTCLAAIIIVNLKGLIFQIKDLIFYFRISLLECILWTVTFVSVVLFDVDIGLYVGICTSFVINTVRTQKPRFVTLGQVDTTGIYKNVVYFPLAHQYDRIKILRFDESLYACNSVFFKRKFYELIGIQNIQSPIIPYGNSKNTHARESPYKCVILDCSPFNYIDTVGVKLLVDIFHDLNKRGIVFFLSECRFEVRQKFDAMKFYEKIDFHKIYVTTHDAVEAARNSLNHELSNSSAVFVPVTHS